MAHFGGSPLATGTCLGRRACTPSLEPSANTGKVTTMPTQACRQGAGAHAPSPASAPQALEVHAHSPPGFSSGVLESRIFQTSFENPHHLHSSAQSLLPLTGPRDKSGLRADVWLLLEKRVGLRGGGRRES
jgi:hypothetical protein